MAKKIDVDMNTKDGIVNVEISPAGRVILEFELAAPHPSNSGKRNLRFSTGGRVPIPGADKGLILMINMDEQR